MKPRDIQNYNAILDAASELMKSKNEEANSLGAAILTVLTANNQDSEEDYRGLLHRIFSYAMDRLKEEEIQLENIDELLEGTGIIKE